MKPHVLSAAGALLMLMAAPLAAQSTNGVLVELFTSQGCSSCPPADAFLAELLDQPGVIPLALHVDYWDYIGWKDTFGKERHAERQRDYARAAGRTMIYTPQMIVAGGESVEGNQPAAVEAAIARAAAVKTGVALDLERHGDAVTIRATADHPLPENGRVQLVRYKPEAAVDITRGENAGASITYHNVVTDWTVLGFWSGAEPLEMSAPVSGPDGVVVIIQNASNIGTFAAAQLK